METPLKLVSEVAECAGCPLRELYPERLPAEREYPGGQPHVFVPPLLVKDGTRLVVGEAPGATEAETGVPFTGGAGGWFDGFLRNAGIPRSTLSIVNTLCCRPPANTYPTSSDAREFFTKEEGIQAVAHCYKNHLLPVLRNRDWKRVDLLGDKALQACAGKIGITNWRGSAVVVPEVHPTELRGMPTIHPAAIARSQSLLPAVISDLKKSLEVPPEHYITVPSLQQVREFRATRFAFDIETRFDIVTRLWTKGITMVGLSSEKYHAILVPFTGLYVDELRRIFRDATEVIGQNCLQFDIPVLEENGVPLAPLAKIWDTMLMQHLLQPDMPHDLEFIASIFTNKPIWKYLKGQGEEIYCLNKQTLIPTPAGNKRICDIKAGDTVYGYDPARGKVETAVSKLHKNRVKDTKWFSVEVDGTSFRGGKWGKHALTLTHDHQIYTGRGWIEAQDLQTTDRVLLERKGGDALIIGTLLGDAHASPKARLTCCHANKAWADAKAQAFGVETHTYKLSTGATRHEFEVGIPLTWRERFYTKKGKRFIPPWGTASLAVWYADDGCLAGGKQPRIACPASFPKKEVIAYFENKYGKGTVSIYNDTGKYYAVALIGAAKHQFLVEIAPWLHPSNAYKLPVELRGKYNGWLEWYNPQWGFVKNVAPFQPTRRGEILTRYCLEVPETSNFFTVDGLVHNCCRDTDATFQAWLQLAPLLRMHKLEELYFSTQVPLARICKIMKDTGMKVDTSNLGKVRDELLAKIRNLNPLLPEDLRSREVSYNKREPAPPGYLSAITGKPLKYMMVPQTEMEHPWRSGEIAMEWLYGEGRCCLPVETNYETDKPTADRLALEKLSNKLKKHTIHVRSELRPKTCPEQVALDLQVAAQIDALREMRKADKLVGTYTADEEDRVEHIHPSFNVHGTNSGRLSSSGPNFQNIPESMRYCYVPDDPEWCFVEADYSQGENRLTAFFAGDNERLLRFNNPNFSEHKFAASIFFGIPMEEVVKSSDKDSPYAKAKHIVHGINFGEGARKIVRDNDLPYNDVVKWQGAWKAAIQKTTDWQNETARLAAKQGYLVTPFLRKRWLYTNSRYTESLSFLPQSTLADISFRAMIALMYERLGMSRESVGHIPVVAPLALPAKLHLQVHDSLLISCPANAVPEVVAQLHRVMEQPWPELAGFFIPIEVKVGAPGASWGECKAYGSK